MRFTVVGAGAVGCLVAVQLHRAGHEVAVIGRPGAVGAIRRHGLRLTFPGGSIRAPVPAFETPAGWGARPGDVVLLAVKCQDARPALAELLFSYPDRGTPIVVLANGLEAERSALRLYRNVQGACVMAPVRLLGPAAVEARHGPVPGVIDLGRFPGGADRTSREVSAALSGAGFASVVRRDIERWKWGKLLINVANGVEAVCGLGSRGGALERRVREEAGSCLRRARVSHVSPARLRARERGCLLGEGQAGSRSHGGSTWQSLERRAGTVETDYLNGEVVRLGRVHGIPVPANEIVQQLAADMARARAAPGSVPEDRVLAALDALAPPGPRPGARDHPPGAPVAGVRVIATGTGDP